MTTEVTGIIACGCADNRSPLYGGLVHATVRSPVPSATRNVRQRRLAWSDAATASARITSPESVSDYVAAARRAMRPGF